REVAELKTKKTVVDVQQELLKTLVKTVKTATGSLMFKTVLQQILKISNRLTDAEESSLFLLDTDGSVIESILARGAVIRELKQNLIGMVLDKGLAGWVIRYRKVGLIADTLHDERWLRLPNEPYTVRSAICVPIFKGKVIQALITLMHSQPRHFTPESAYLMQMSAEPIAIILEHAALYVERQNSQPESHIIDQQADQKLHKNDEQPDSEEKLSLLGIYIIIEDGRFLYTNPGVAAIFGYTFIEFITIESILQLVAASNREFFAAQINQCFQTYSQSKSLSCTFKGQRKNGSLIDVQVYGTKTKFSGKPVIIGVLSSV
ncbi:MAG TPA: diguanylate cyclase, partial [Cyanobacteria bacterium UBA8543]|nr:diguanylate cyclase [Cyanobacteria bacterium UBA8543]